jgi:hypothetical protein
MRKREVDSSVKEEGREEGWRGTGRYGPDGVDGEAELARS